MHIPENLKKTFQQNFKKRAKSHFTQLPDFIHHLTYIEKVVNRITGEEEWHRKRLTPTDKTVFAVILKTCGDKGKCWKSTETLAEEAYCSTGQIVASKKVLAQCFEQLGGQSLIDIEVKHQATIRDEKIINRRYTHHIRVNQELWSFNAGYMSVAKEMPKLKRGKITNQEADYALEMMFQDLTTDDFVHNLGARSENERAGGARSENEPATQRARSDIEPNHIPEKKTPYSVKTDPVPRMRPEQVLLLKDLVEGIDWDETSNSMYHWLVGFGINKKTTKELIELFSPKDIFRVLKGFASTWEQVIFQRSPEAYVMWRLRKECALMR